MTASNPCNITVHTEAQHREIFKRRWTEAVLKSKMNGEEMEIRRMESIQNLTETVTVNGRPLSHLYDSGMRKLNRREVELLTSNGHGTGLSAGQSKCPPAVLEHIDFLSSEIINEIRP